MKSCSTAAVTALEPPARVPLGTDELEFGQAGHTQRWPCQISLTTEPSPRLGFEVVTRIPTISLESAATVHLVHAGCTCDVFVSSITPGEDTRIVLHPVHTPISAGSSQRLTEVRFDVLNFPDFFSGTIRNRVDMTADCWRLMLEPAAARNETTAFRSPLYQITHSGLIKRADAAPFASSDAVRVLDAFHAALSFAAGRWVAPVLVRGMEADGTCAWQEWGTRPLHPSLSAIDTWFDRFHGQALADLMPGVYRLWNDDAWAHAIRAALYWYARAAGLEAGPDGGIILLQAALELLCWRIFVQDRRSVSAAGFRRLSAADQIRLLLESCQVPAGFPTGLAALKARAEELNWVDGPQALASIRKQLTHPTQSPDLPYVECGQLAAWYVELVLLKLFEYSGEYSNRTRAGWRAGSVERVPWSH